MGNQKEDHAATKKEMKINKSTYMMIQGGEGDGTDTFLLPTNTNLGFYYS